MYHPGSHRLPQLCLYKEMYLLSFESAQAESGKRCKPGLERQSLATRLCYGKKIGATGFEPATPRTPSECAKPGCATPRLALEYDFKESEASLKSPAALSLSRR